MRNSTRRNSPALLVILALLAFAPSANAVVMPAQGERNESIRMLDARVNDNAAYTRALAARPGVAAQGLQFSQQNRALVAQGALRARNLIPGVTARYSSVTGAPDSLSSLKGTLTPSAPGQTSEAIVRGFLRDYADLFGLNNRDLADIVAIGDSNGAQSGLRMLRMEQVIDGRAVFQSESRFLLTTDGRLAKYVGQLVPQARSSVVASGSLMSAQDALGALGTSLGKTIDPDPAPGADRDGWR